MASFLETIHKPSDEFFGNPDPGASGVSDTVVLLQNAAGIGVSILVTLATLMIIVASYQLITAHGNEEQVTKGKKTLMWAVGGLVLGVLAYSIVSILTGAVLNPAGFLTETP